MPGSRLHPYVSARISALAKSCGFKKTGHSYRRSAGDDQGLILDFDEQELGPQGAIHGSRWYLAVCPAAYVRFLSRVSGEHRPFERFRAQYEGALILEPPWRVDAPYAGEPGYDTRREPDMAAFADHVEAWLVEILPRALNWLDDPGELVDAVADDESRPQAERAIAGVMILPGGLQAIQAAAGRFDDARKGLEEWDRMAKDRPETARNAALARIVREMYPQLQ